MGDSCLETGNGGRNLTMIHVRELLLEDGSSPYTDWFETLPAVVAAKITTAKLRMEQGNLSNVKWYRGIGEYKLDFGPGWHLSGKGRRRDNRFARWWQQKTSAKRHCSSPLTLGEL